jgi:ABC-2 type transport system ATP-binding protein
MPRSCCCSTVGLDVEGRQFLLDHVRRLCREDGIAVLWATHLIDEVVPEARVVVLHRGSVMAHGSVAEILAGTGESSVRAAFDALTRRGEAKP